MKVYGIVDQVTEQHYGEKFFIDIVAIKNIEKTGAEWVHDNGYYTRILPIYVDYQGREYKECESIDGPHYFLCAIPHIEPYLKGTSIETIDTYHFYRKPPNRSRDVMGNGLTRFTPPRLSM